MLTKITRFSDAVASTRQYYRLVRVISMKELREALTFRLIICWRHARDENISALCRASDDACHYSRHDGSARMIFLM